MDGGQWAVDRGWWRVEGGGLSVDGEQGTGDRSVWSLELRVEGAGWEFMGWGRWKVFRGRLSEV